MISHTFFRFGVLKPNMKFNAIKIRRQTRQMNTDWTGIYTCKECHKTESCWNHTTTDHKEGEQLEDRRNAGENSCNSGDGMDQTGPILDVYDDDDDD